LETKLPSERHPNASWETKKPSKGDLIAALVSQPKKSVARTLAWFLDA